MALIVILDVGSALRRPALHIVGRSWASAERTRLGYNARASTENRTRLPPVRIKNPSTGPDLLQGAANVAQHK